MNPAQALEKLLFVSTFPYSMRSRASRADRCEWTWLHQCTSVEQGMFLLSVHRVELEVHCDDDN